MINYTQIQVLNATDETLKNAINSWGDCKFRNKNLNNGNNACTGKVILKEGVLDILYQINTNNQIILQSVSTTEGSTDPFKTLLPLELFKGTWNYSLINREITLKKVVSQNQKYLNSTLQFRKIE